MGEIIHAPLSGCGFPEKCNKSRKIVFDGLLIGKEGENGAVYDDFCIRLKEEGIKSTDIAPMGVLFNSFDVVNKQINHLSARIHELEKKLEEKG